MWSLFIMSNAIVILELDMNSRGCTKSVQIWKYRERTQGTNILATHPERSTFGDSSLSGYAWKGKLQSVDRLPVVRKNQMYSPSEYNVSSTRAWMLIHSYNFHTHALTDKRINALTCINKHVAIIVNRLSSYQIGSGIDKGYVAQLQTKSLLCCPPYNKG